MSNDFNFISRGTVTERDIDLLFGPNEPEDGPIEVLEPHWLLAHVMHASGIFKSVSEAKRNGWDKPIPEGWSQFVVTKRKVGVYIFKKT
jgi:hypothetical protein